ncbi:hypothetical protein CORT_0B00830 [Candida orthopsilosis Co 90-125]|uniref:Uncharacterized protein n=1 Tax=Candida orthopsilosis (strain 90-125) TaxID=1136231 RepID=H8WZD6_CANO9|nr:hypothetical protein CORT_0B00830 [Candida orthopsilosis Co 90-125]CCG21804.1 hypothetical protein CORT_0B00830 [Candida orthopsilosis Co 90-125]
MPLITSTSTPKATAASNSSSTTDDSLVEGAYNLLDSLLFYLMNLMLFVLLFTDLVMDFVHNCIYGYNIVACSFKHKLYNNIN